MMQPRSKLDRLVLTPRLVETGQTLVVEAQQFAKTAFNRARGIRNGLMISLLAFCPIRCVGGNERDRTSRGNVRFHRGSRACFGGGRKRGAGRSSARPLVRRLLDQNPPEGRSRRPAARLSSHRRRSHDSRNFEVLLNLGPDITPRAAITDKGYDAKANREAARRRGICPVIPYKSTQSTVRFTSRKGSTRLQGAGAHRTGGQQAQALQADRTSMREDNKKLRFLRGHRPRLHLDQIRPHGPSFGACAIFTSGASLMLPICTLTWRITLLWTISA